MDPQGWLIYEWLIYGEYMANNDGYYMVNDDGYYMVNDDGYYMVNDG